MKIQVKKNNYGAYIAIAVVAILAIVGVVGAYTGSTQQVIENVENLVINNPVGGFGAAPSDIASGFYDMYVENDLTVDGSLTVEGTLDGVLTTGGGLYNSTTTDSTTYTLVQADIEDYSYLDLDYTAGGAITYTLPATSTMMSLLPEIGSTREWLIHNASTTAIMTIAAGTGTNLLGIDTNVDTIAADGWAKLECTQIVYSNNENIACLMEEYVVAD